MENKKETKKLFNSILERQIPAVIRQSGSNIQLGVVIGYNTLTRATSVKMRSNAQVILNVAVPTQISSLTIGDEVVMISVDGNFSSRYYIVASFRGNFRNTVDA